MGLLCQSAAKAVAEHSTAAPDASSAPLLKAMQISEPTAWKMPAFQTAIFPEILGHFSMQVNRKDIQQ